MSIPLLHDVPNATPPILPQIHLPSEDIAGIRAFGRFGFCVTPRLLGEHTPLSTKKYTYFLRRLHLFQEKDTRLSLCDRYNKIFIVVTYIVPF